MARFGEGNDPTPIPSQFADRLMHLRTTYDSMAPSVATTLSDLQVDFELQPDSAPMLSIQQSVQDPSFPVPRERLVQGLIWAEILGPPISRRKGRGRQGLY